MEIARIRNTFAIADKLVLDSKERAVRDNNRPGRNSTRKFTVNF